MFIRMLVSGFLVFAGTSAMASEDEGTPNQQKLTLDDLKAKCRDLIADPQRKTIHAKITCSDFSHQWDQTQQGKGKLKNGRKAGAQVQLKNFVVAQQYFDQKKGDTEIACDQYVRVEKHVDSVETDVSCQDLLLIDDLGAYCADKVDQRVADDEGIVKTTVTNEIISLCP